MSEPRKTLTDDEIVTTPLAGSRSRAETGDDADTDDTDVDTDDTDDTDADSDDPS